MGTGVTLWTASLTVVTTDVGTLGAGVGLGPCAIPPSLLLPSLLSSLPSAGVKGVSMPSLATGLALGLSLAFTSQGVVTTIHPSVGAGTGICSFPGPSAVPFMLSGFAAAGLTGSSAVQMATGIGVGLDVGFGAFSLPIVIVGPPSPSPSTGAGTGKIV